MTDDRQYFQDILGEANRSDVSFYTIDPRGLVVFDSPIGPDPPLPLATDAAMVHSRQESLRLLALNTDGLALLNSNDLGKQLRRVSADLTSYYLIGYYSTNTKLDGKYRTITVRVKQPGVEIRARKGYRAPSAAEVAAAAKAPAPGTAPNANDKAAIAAALGAIDLAAHDTHSTRRAGEPAVFHRGPTTGNQLEPAPTRTFSRTERVHLEVEGASGAPGWSGALLDRNGRTLPVPIQTGERLDSAGQRWLTADLTLAPLGAGDYIIQLTRADGTRTLTAIRVTQ